MSGLNTSPNMKIPKTCSVNVMVSNMEEVVVFYLKYGTLNAILDILPLSLRIRIDLKF
jgi:hypothetical protein